jgi:hypothetical protein
MARIKLWIVGILVSLFLVWYLWAIFGMKLTIPIAIAIYLIFVIKLLPKAKQKIQEVIEE